MRILVLEDSPERIGEFVNMFGDHSLVIVNTAADAISFLSTSKFDVVFLDHDLGGKVYVDSEEENTGYQVAKMLPVSLNRHTPVIIHSWNGAGAKRMLNALKDHDAQVVYKIFGNFDRSILRP